MALRDARATRAIRAVERTWEGLDRVLWLAVLAVLSTVIGWGLLKLAGFSPLSSPVDVTLVGHTVSIAPWMGQGFAALVAGAVLLFVLDLAFLREHDSSPLAIAGVAAAILILLGLETALASVLFGIVNKFWTAAAGLLLAAYFLVATRNWWTRAGNEKRLQPYRRLILMVGSPLAATALLFGLLVDTEAWRWPSAIFVAFVCTALVLGLFQATIDATAKIRPHIKEYGPSVSTGTVLFFVVGAPAIIILSHAASRYQAAQAAATPFWSWATLALVGFVGVMAAYRSFRRRDRSIAESQAQVRFLTPRVSAKSALKSALKAEGPARRRGVLRSLDLAVHRFIATPTRKLTGTLAATIAFLIAAIQVIVSVIDYWLAMILAPLFGASLQGRARRYGAMMFYLSVAALLIYILPGLSALLGLGVAVLVALAIARRWNWVEGDRQLYFDVRDDRPGPRTRIRIGFDQDLGDEAIVCFLLLFGLHLPLALWQIDQALSLFTYAGAGAPGYFEWLTFIGGELAKAAPFVDWSEVYGVRNEESFAPRSELAQHVVFAVRVGMDLLLLATILQVFSTSQRLSRQLERFEDPGDPTSLLDPFDEREIFSKAWEDWQTVHRLRFYDDQRLKQVILMPLDRVSALGAAKAAGYGLASGTLRMLVFPVTQDLVRLGQANDLGVRLHHELRAASLSGLRRRVKAASAQRNATRYAKVVERLAEPSRRRFSRPPLGSEGQELRNALDAAFETMGRERDVELLVRRIADGAPKLSETARSELLNRPSEDQAHVLDLFFSEDEDLAIAALRSLDVVQCAFTEPLLALLEKSRSERVLASAAMAAALPSAHAAFGLLKLIREGPAGAAVSAIQAIKIISGRGEKLPPGTTPLLHALGYGVRGLLRGDRAEAARDALHAIDPTRYKRSMLDRLLGGLQPN